MVEEQMIVMVKLSLGSSALTRLVTDELDVESEAVRRLCSWCRIL